VVHALIVDAMAERGSVAELRAKWQSVAICEVDGNWSMIGPVYSGIGFLNSTWYQYGGRRFAPVAGEATVDQQILIGMRVTHGWIPDQYGCSPVGW
jgi:resuscitation-promoting factor RpfA